MCPTCSPGAKAATLSPNPESTPQGEQFFFCSLRNNVFVCLQRPGGAPGTPVKLGVQDAAHSTGRIADVPAAAAPAPHVVHASSTGNLKEMGEGGGGREARSARKAGGGGTGVSGGTLSKLQQQQQQLLLQQWQQQQQIMSAGLSASLRAAGRPPLAVDSPSKPTATVPAAAGRPETGAAAAAAATAGKPSAAPTGRGPLSKGLSNMSRQRQTTPAMAPPAPAGAPVAAVPRIMATGPRVVLAPGM